MPVLSSSIQQVEFRVGIPIMGETLPCSETTQAICYLDLSWVGVASWIQTCFPHLSTPLKKPPEGCVKDHQGLGNKERLWSLLTSPSQQFTALLTQLPEHSDTALLLLIFIPPPLPSPPLLLASRYFSEVNQCQAVLTLTVLIWFLWPNYVLGVWSGDRKRVEGIIGNGFPEEFA